MKTIVLFLGTTAIEEEGEVRSVALITGGLLVVKLRSRIVGVMDWDDYKGLHPRQIQSSNHN